MSTVPASSRPMFSAEPLVFCVTTLSDGSVSLMAAAALSPKNGKPPPGVAVARVTLVWAAADDMAAQSVSASANASRAESEKHRMRRRALCPLPQGERAQIWASRPRIGNSLRRRQPLLQVGDDVRHILQSD